MSQPDFNIGKAFRDDTGLVRWIIGKSNRNYYQLLWLDETTGVWNQGGISKTIPQGEEVPAPQPGNIYKLAGTFNGYREQMAFPEEAQRRATEKERLASVWRNEHPITSGLL